MATIKRQVCLPRASRYRPSHCFMKTLMSRINLSTAGFTLIEVVVVLAIIAILALMAIPMFYAKVPRAQIEESIPLARIATAKVADYYLKKNALPANNEAAGLPDASKLIGNYVAAVTVVDGAVTMSFRADANGKIAGKRLTWRPAIVKDTAVTPVAWVCANKKVPDGMVVGGVDVTDVPLDSVPLAPVCGLSMAEK
jgi:type IV pilus assembly protein PilA